ncbi:MAG: hypothetical protein A2V70_15285, partial [Planctomycetes bacterium RBG_13_63_9]
KEMEGAAAALKKLDKNEDGKLDRDELRPPFGGPGGPGGPPMPGQAGRAAGRGMGFGPGGPPGSRAGASSFEGSPTAKDDAEKRILGVLDDMDRNQRRGMMNVPKEDGRLLRLLAETVGAKNVVEIGTSNGYSGIWFCMALRNTGGKLTTFEIDERRASLARENFQRAGVEGMVTLVEGDAHEQVADLKGPIDVVFVDADKEGYVDYLEKLLPLVRPGGLIVAHNMNMRQADDRYVKAVTTNPDLETLFLHMQGAGVGVTLKKR